MSASATQGGHKKRQTTKICKMLYKYVMERIMVINCVEIADIGGGIVT